MLSLLYAISKKNLASITIVTRLEQDEIVLFFVFFVFLLFFFFVFFFLFFCFFFRLVVSNLRTKLGLHYSFLCINE